MVQLCWVEIWDDFDVLIYSTVCDSEKSHQFPKLVCHLIDAEQLAIYSHNNFFKPNNVV
jgi:hypothetical protein